MLTRFTSIHLAWHAFRRMAPLGIQHNISTIFCLCVSFGSIFLLCCGCFGKCFFSLLAQFLSLRSTKVLIFLLNLFCLRHIISLQSKVHVLHSFFSSVISDDGIGKPTHSILVSFPLGQITFRGEIIFYFWFKLNRARRTFLRFIFKILSSSSIEYLIILIMGRFTVCQSRDGLCKTNTDRAVYNFLLKLPHHLKPLCFCFF